jgi:predicted ester cyclase
MTTAGDNVQMQNKEIISRHFEDLWNQGRLDLVSTYHASDFINFGMPFPLDRLHQTVEAWRAAFPDLHFTIDEQIAEGDQVVSHCTLSGTYLKPFMLLGLGNCERFLPAFSPSGCGLSMCATSRKTLAESSSFAINRRRISFSDPSFSSLSFS